MSQLTTCLGCGQEDDHPKDNVYVGGDKPWVHWHMDCHARAGCEDCAHSTRNQGDARGEEFRQILLTQDAKEA